MTSKKHALRNLILIGFLLIGLGQVGLLLLAILPAFPTMQFAFPLTGFVTILWLILFSVTFWFVVNSRQKFAPPFFPGLNMLIQKTENPHRTSIWVHWVYLVVGFVNTVILLLGFGLVLATRNWTPSWGFFAGMSAILAIYYNRFILSSLGQRSEDNSGSSFVLAASLAALSSKMFSKNRKEGLAPLLEAMRMTRRLFYYRRYTPTLLAAVQTTVEGLIDIEQEHLPYSHLEKLAESLKLLPRREGLHPAFGEFLQEMKWPGGFETVERRRISSYDLLILAVFTATAIGSLLVIVPRAVQETFYKDVVSLASTQGWSIIGGAMFFVGIFYWPFLSRYESYFWYFRKYLSD